MKYIVFRTPSGEAPVLFPGSFTHSWVAGQFSMMAVVSAGFVVIEDGRPRCFGHSSSLHIASRGDVDSALVTKQMTMDAG